MAELFLAQEPPNPELVVLKRILPYLSEEPEFVQMFLDEARIAAQLHHPNIVQVYELGKLDNTIFIAMEFVEGVDLRRVVQEESKFGATVPYGVAAAICAGVAEGLDYAHFSKGVDGRPLELIHRDVSPQNVMIGYDGRVKLVDFGIAKAGTYMNRSKPGVIKGKFLYLSPEQVAQEKLDHRSDIFALGTMMYEITTGKSPFAKPTTEGILYAIRSEDPSPPHLLKDDYPTDLSRIIMRCLVKDRNQRYQRTSEVQADLEKFLVSGAIKQSTDVADYIARLMGEEEERTVLHIPVAASGRKDGTVAMSPGLANRPQRRPTGDGVALPPDDYGNEPEPPTQMARPQELLDRAAPPVDDDPEVSGSSRAYGEDDEEAGPDVSTAIGTVPSVIQTDPSVVATTFERVPGRASSTPSPVTTGARRAPPVDRDTEPRARRPSAPTSRRPRLEEEISSPSISLTQPTGRVRTALGEGDDASTDGDGDEISQPGSVAPRTTGQRRRLSNGSPSAPVAGGMTGQRRRLSDSAQSVTESTTGQRRRLSDSASVTESTSGQRRRLPDESNPSITLNQRGSRQRQALGDDDGPLETEQEDAELDESQMDESEMDESQMDESQMDESEMDDDGGPTEGIRADAEDDESTAGYDAESAAVAPRGRWLIVALVGVGAMLVVGAGLLWLLSSTMLQGTTDPVGPQEPVPITPPKASATPTNPAAPAPSEAAPGTAPSETPSAPDNGTPPEVAAAGQDPAAPATADPAATPTDNPSGGTTNPGAIAVVTDTPEDPQQGAAATGTAAAVGTNGATSPGTTPAANPGTADAKPPKPPQIVEVMFKTNSAVIRVGRKKVEANKVLTYPAGEITVEWWCPPKRKREGSDVKRLKAGRKDPYVYDIRCRKSSR